MNKFLQGLHGIQAAALSDFPLQYGKDSQSGEEDPPKPKAYLLHCELSGSWPGVSTAFVGLGGAVLRGEDQGDAFAQQAWKGRSAL